MIKNKFEKALVPEDLNLIEFLGTKNYDYLVKYGVLKEIGNYTFNITEKLCFDENHLLLGSDILETNIYLTIELNSRKVNFFDDQSEESTFINSNYYMLVESIILYDKFIKSIQKQKDIGSKLKTSEEYSLELKDCLSRIDEFSVVKGYWFNLIEEIEIGAYWYF